MFCCWFPPGVKRFQSRVGGISEFSSLDIAFTVDNTLNALFHGYCPIISMFVDVEVVGCRDHVTSSSFYGAFVFALFTVVL